MINMMRMYSKKQTKLYIAYQSWLTSEALKKQVRKLFCLIIRELYSPAKFIKMKTIPNCV